MFQIASVARMPQANVDSEMEEGEIVDDLDDLSDISSEEEFLLRQRLEVLEDYNNVLERSKKKRSSGVSGLNQTQDLHSDLSEISTAEIDTQINGTNHTLKVSRSIKQCSKPKRRKEPVYKTVEEAYVKRKREYRKKPNHVKRKPVKVVSESSDESEDEYRNKRKKLADAVKVHKSKTDSSSLSARLKKMLHRPEECLSTETDLLNLCVSNNYQNEVQVQLSPVHLEGSDVVDCRQIKSLTLKGMAKSEIQCDAIELSSSDDDVKVITEEQPPVQTDISVPKIQDKDSDEDLDFLRQQVLSTKSLKAKPKVEPEIKIPTDDEDSDTAELRLICLKSTIIKRAMEIKQKQKRNKRLSQSQTTLEEDIFNDSIFFSKIDSENNTDIETMDMDMGSDAEEKKENKDETRPKKIDDRLHENNHTSVKRTIPRTSKQDEVEEDEDLLRAKLLTSLTKNLPNLVNPEILNTIKNVKSTKPTETKANVPEKRFIIKLGESDSEGEHEATKNLTKMHMKLSESTDFQQQLDLFLKSTRMQVENSKLPDVVKKQPTPRKPEKFVAKMVNSLPKPEQMEYKNLVRRMAELEKLKQLREAQLNSATRPFKDKNTIVDTKFEEKISISRKRIADESAKMLKLKEEATKLSQRYNIVATELHNVSTAITLNKKQQRAVQSCLTKIRQQHQSLIKSSSTSLHSKVNSHNNNISAKVATTTRIQKENNPKDEYKNSAALKTVKISVVNDLKNDKNTNQLSVHVNIANNKKVVKIPNSVKGRIVEISETTEKEPLLPESLETMDPLDKDICKNTLSSENRVGNSKDEEINKSTQGYTADDYKSPLDVFGDTSWESDPNAILCPYEVGGQCKDPDCKYLHTQTSEQ